MFGSDSVNLPLLMQRAFNLRWASVPEGVIPLTAADPDFPCAEPIREAIHAFTKDGYFSYGDTFGYEPFKQALSLNYANVKHTAFHPSHILPVDSAAYGIYLICKTFLKSGNEAIIFDPVDFLFRYSIETVGATAVPFAIPAGTDLVDFNSLEEIITPNTKMICLCNPLNPTGKVFSKEELNSLGSIAIKHNLLILSDEIWSDIIFKPAVFNSMASLDEEIRKLTITVTGFSKSYGLAGLRIGAIMTTNDNHFKSIYQASLHQSTVHGTNILGQVAATAALNQCNDWLQDFIKHLQKMRDLTIDALIKLNGVHCIAPDGCYVAFANITETGLSSAEMHKLLLEKGKVAIVPGLKQWFGEGAEGYIRLSFATSEEILTEALSRIKKVL